MPVGTKSPLKRREEKKEKGREEKDCAEHIDIVLKLLLDVSSCEVDTGAEHLSRLHICHHTLPDQHYFRSVNLLCHHSLFTSVF